MTHHLLSVHNVEGEAREPMTDEAMAQSHQQLGVLEPLPTGVRQVDGPEQARTALVFADDAASLRELMATHQEQLARPEVLWVAYPQGEPDRHQPR